MPEFYKVNLTHPDHHDKTVFRSVSSTRAKAFVEARYPRGSEAHLGTPTGERYHYEHERAHPEGLDIDRWQEFDPSSWVAVADVSTPSDSPTADREG